MEEIFINTKFFGKNFYLTVNPAKKRLVQFIDSQGISKRKFSEKISVSHVYFSGDNAVGSDVLEKISSEFPELNMDWVISGRGEMIYKEPAPAGDQEAENQMQGKLIDSLIQRILDKDKIIALLEQQCLEVKKITPPAKIL